MSTAAASIAWPDSGSLIRLPPDSVAVTAVAPVNIAVIKYWGKRDERLILPINSSLSGSIHLDSMRANTLILASRSLPSSSLTLNGRQEAINSRLQAVITALQQRAQPLVQDGRVIIAKEDWPSYRLSIRSVNNFPTAAGLASSAAGYACFTRCLAELYGVQEAYPGELTTIARQGSGSACRSLYGGFVRWSMGAAADGSDSVASQVISESHWPELRVLILVANRAQKETSSTDGMQRSVQTSALLSYRAQHVVERRMQQMEAALQQRDWAVFCELSMRDSNQFHATCIDTYPPIFYLNNTSQHIIHLITAVNAAAPAADPVACYTFDAGPNAVIYTTQQHLHSLIALFRLYYGKEAADDWLYDPMRLAAEGEEKVRQDWLQAVGGGGAVKGDVKVHQLIVSRIGGGAAVAGRAHSFAA